jgi:hypothetical protein
MEKTLSGVPLPDNYESKMSIRVGLIAGVAGSLSIMVVVTAILIVTGSDVWTAARLIASVVYGPDAAEGIAPIIVGTLIHLVTGGALGAIFGGLVPCVPRGFWVIIGLMYGIAAWLVSTFVVLPIIAPPMIEADTNIYVLLFAHVLYGLVLGIAGASYKLWWRLPPWLDSEPDPETL